MRMNGGFLARAVRLGTMTAAAGLLASGALAATYGGRGTDLPFEIDRGSRNEVRLDDRGGDRGGDRDDDRRGDRGNDRGHGNDHAWNLPDLPGFPGQGKDRGQGHGHGHGGKGGGGKGGGGGQCRR
jgi:hypothetical protein